MNHSQNAVELAVAVGRRAAHAKAAHVHALRPVENVFDHAPGQNHARIRAKLAGRVLHVLPGEAVAAGHDVVIQKDQRLGRIDAKPLKIRRGAVAVDVIDAHEPCVFSVGDGQAAVRCPGIWDARRPCRRRWAADGRLRAGSASALPW